MGNHRRVRRPTPEKAFAAAGLQKARCLGSKSLYRATHRRHFFIPNAYVFSRSAGLIWWGDLDLWVDAQKMEHVARALGHRLYVLPEYRAAQDALIVPFLEVRRRAAWHTGGAVRPDVRMIKRSGLNLRVLAYLAGTTPQRLNRPQRPYVALQINQKLRDLEVYFGPLTQHHGYKRWGDWFLAPHPAIKHRSPLEVFQAEGKLTPSELFGDIYSSKKLLYRYSTAIIGALVLSAGTVVRTEWPISERRRRESLRSPSLA